MGIGRLRRANQIEALVVIILKLCKERGLKVWNRYR